jgi:hypothetical protein
MRQNLNDLDRCHDEWCANAIAKQADAKS